LSTPLPRRAALALIAALTPLMASCVASPAAADPAPPTATPTAAPAPTASRPTVRAPQIELAAGTVSQGSMVRGRVTPADARLTLGGQPVAVADDGAFIIAFDRDAPPQALLRAENSAGASERSIAVAGFDWPIERINARMTGEAATDEEFRARRSGELAQIAAARAVQARSDGWRQRFIWPVAGRVSGRFGRQRIYQGQPGSFHSGTDIAAAAGTPFVAPADGVVVLAAQTPFTLEGYLLIVDHGMGLSSAFLHCRRLDVRVGDVVRQGQVLGQVGATGRATGPHMHWGLKWQDARIDPEQIVGAAGQ
jgi:murein DD-endopeptidase MepM/ murein hydrolase activator NlpD